MNKLLNTYFKIRLSYIKSKIQEKERVSPEFAKVLETDVEVAIQHYSYPCDSLQKLYKIKDKLEDKLNQ